ncbi:MAG TPA: 2-oxoacid:acceptor oxidoreductase family protein, partial [Candidatus Polarisedimenticolaceae bacterium]|nr:2-oxoacid:acceptor oxidoreductase family protein [Candidatus Polarisedimenticolaceae bacterium]
NAVYGMTGGQMAPTTLIGMETTTTPAGRVAENEGFPIKVCELLATLDAPYYLERVALGDAKHNHRARIAVRKAIRNQLDDRGFSLVELLSPCPTGWKLAPVEAARFTIERMQRDFPLGVVRDGHGLSLGHPRLRRPVDLGDLPGLLETTDASTELELPDRGRAIEETRHKFAGFGGQGVLLLGVLLARAGMLAGRNVSWIPSYGPEMRGGTANCGVTISDAEIGSPLIQNPDVLVAMNGPSLDRFAADVVPGGTIYYNSSMIAAAPARTDVVRVAVPANDIADSLGNPKVANIVVLGSMLAGGAVVSREAILAALPGVIKDKPELIELNRRALHAGMEAFAVV